MEEHMAMVDEMITYSTRDKSKTILEAVMVLFWT